MSGLWLAGLVLLFQFRAVLLPFGLALLLAFILEPAVERLAGRRIGRWTINRTVALLASIAVLVTLGGTFFTWALARVVQELSKLRLVTGQVVGELRGLVGRGLDGLEGVLSDSGIPLDRAGLQDLLEQNLVHAVEEMSQDASSLLSFGTGVVGIAFHVVFGLFLVLMLTTFISMDRFRIEAFFESLVPREARPAFLVLRDGVSRGLTGVVRGQLAICLTNGVLTFVGLWLLNVKLPLILAGVAAVFSLIPIFGSILSTIPIVAMGLIDGVSKAVLALLWIVGIHLLEANFLNPKIMGDATKIHPVIVVFALVAGEKGYGLMGALFAVPIASVVVTLFKFLHARARAPDSEPSAPAESPAS